jgi:hypothetical protein
LVQKVPQEQTVSLGRVARLDQKVPQDAMVSRDLMADQDLQVVPVT